jgi:environmental stress-induced protein Ves
VCLTTVGAEPRELTPSHPALHAFPGDALTHCTALGASTRDFNIMARRSRLSLQHWPLQELSGLESRAEGVGLFVVHAAEVREESGSVHQVPGMALAWWPNPQRARLSLRVDSAPGRGWWFAVDTHLQRAPTP